MRILIVEDSEAEAYLIETMFRDTESFAGELVHLNNFDDAQSELETGAFDIAFIDYHLTDGNGLMALLVFILLPLSCLALHAVRRECGRLARRQAWPTRTVATARILLASSGLVATLALLSS